MAVSQVFAGVAGYGSRVELVPAVVYEDRGHTTIYVSPQIEDILGVTPESYMQDAGMWLRMVHPDDRESVRAQSDASSPAKAATSTTTAWFVPTVGWCGSVTAPTPTETTPAA